MFHSLRLHDHEPRHRRDVRADGWRDPTNAGALHPLDIAGRLVQEDLVVLVERAEGLVVGGGSVCFPNRWNLASKLGLCLVDVHAPVSRLNDQLGGSVDTFFDRLGSDRSFWRLGWSVLDTGDLYQPTDGTAPPLDPLPKTDGVVRLAGARLFPTRRAARRSDGSQERGACCFRCDVLRLCHSPPATRRPAAARGSRASGEFDLQRSPHQASAWAWLPAGRRSTLEARDS